jgi:hypothetical protein
METLSAVRLPCVVKLCDRLVRATLSPTFVVAPAVMVATPAYVSYVIGIPASHQAVAP